MVYLLSWTAVLTSYAALVTAGPTRRAMAVLESRDAPSSFTSQGPANETSVLNLRIGLLAKNMTGLEDALYAVSTPGSELYGQHLSFDEVAAFASPTPETTNAVTEWLKDNGIEASLSGPFNDWLTLSIPVSKANDLLATDFQDFVHIASGERFIRTLAYAIPQDLLPHIELVHPTTAFTKPLAARPSFNPIVSIPIPPSAANVSERALTAPASCKTTITPACLEALYGIPATAATQKTNVLGVSGFIDQFAQTADLRSFLTRLRPDVSPATTFTLQTLDGGQNLQGVKDAGIEANLDTQYTVGVATGVPTVFVSVGDDNMDGDAGGFLDIINFLNAETAPPQVLTTSYGFDEPDLGTTLSTRICNAYMTLGARGVSILFASGDGGVAGGQAQSCTTFIPAFPGGCAFHTAVGATTGTSPEVAASFSSGGFSNIFARPSYQAAAVATYLTALGNTNAGLFNVSGRGFPDVSAQGENVEIVDGGEFGTVAGTSCSSPIFASTVALINDRLIAAGKPVLGFLNPFLYANPQAFFDITSGSNPGCGTNGFPATTGWDPVTGLGTPNFAAMLTAAGL